MLFASHRDTYPSEEAARLYPHFGVLVDLAREHDQAGDGVPTSAQEFIAWLQLNQRDIPSSVQPERMLDRHRRAG